VFGSNRAWRKWVDGLAAAKRRSRVDWVLDAELHAGAIHEGKGEWGQLPQSVRDGVLERSATGLCKSGLHFLGVAFSPEQALASAKGRAAEFSTVDGFPELVERSPYGVLDHLALGFVAGAVVRAGFGEAGVVVDRNEFQDLDRWELVFHTAEENWEWLYHRMRGRDPDEWPAKAEWPLEPRLKEEDSAKQPGLQAADLVGYSVMFEKLIELGFRQAPVPASVPCFRKRKRVAFGSAMARGHEHWMVLTDVPRVVQRGHNWVQRKVGRRRRR